MTVVEFNIAVEGAGHRQLTAAWLGEAMARQKMLKPLKHYLGASTQAKRLTDKEIEIKEREHNELLTGLKAAEERKRG